MAIARLCVQKIIQWQPAPLRARKGVRLHTSLKTPYPVFLNKITSKTAEGG